MSAVLLRLLCCCARLRCTRQFQLNSMPMPMPMIQVECKALCCIQPQHGLANRGYTALI